MNTGKFFVLAIALSAAIAGGAMYYYQVYAFYDEVPVTEDAVQITALGGEVETLFVEEFQGIDSDSSPIRYRACFLPEMSVAAMSETYVVIDNAVPLVAPGWFDCFDAVAIGEALETGEAVAFMGVENITYGIDRVIAVMPDGSAVSWQQINACGETVFNREAPPEGCPPAPEALQ